MGLEYLKQRKNELNMTTEELSEKSGVPIGTLNKMLAGQTSDPKFETLKSICRALDISLSDLDEYDAQGYYFDSDAAKMAQELFDRPEMKVLFDASRKATKEDIEQVAEILKKLSGK